MDTLEIAAYVKRLMMYSEPVKIESVDESIEPDGTIALNAKFTDGTQAQIAVWVATPNHRTPRSYYRVKNPLING